MLIFHSVIQLSFWPNLLLPSSKFPSARSEKNINMICLNSNLDHFWYLIKHFSLIAFELWAQYQFVKWFVNVFLERRARGAHIDWKRSRSFRLFTNETLKNSNVFIIDLNFKIFSFFGDERCSPNIYYSLTARENRLREKNFTKYISVWVECLSAAAQKEN